MDHVQIASMLSPATYGEPTATVQHLQTHISHIFLTDCFVYKIKKPVDFGFLDFTTLEKRRHFCEEELRLNRRLSPDIYLGVVPLCRAADGSYNLRGNGEVVEYAVKMKRMPAERMMSLMLERGEVSEAQIDAIAERVAQFHGEAERGGGIALFGTVEALSVNWLENLRQTEAYIGRTITAAEHADITAWAFRLLDQQSALFRERVKNGYIRECDGDLHSENICLDNGQIHIFDCIEFNEKFRFSDTAADVAFLAMDLEYHGRRELAERFIGSYVSAGNDTGLRQVLPLYLANRAFIRGKVESFRLDDPLISADQKGAAAERARRFFRLAHGYVLRERLALTLFLTCGLTGCGKSALAAELAFQLGLAQLSSDCERKKLAGLAPTARGAAIYDHDWNQATYGQLLQLAREQLAAGRSVVVDATFRDQQERRRFREAAAELGAETVTLLLDCPEALVRTRLEQRQADNTSVSDGTWQVYLRQAAGFIRPDEQEGRLVQLDAGLSPPQQVAALLAQYLPAAAE